MKKRTLGRTGIEVTELSLGGLFISRVGGGYEQGKAAIDRALELGVNYADTAPGYSDSEEVLGRALEGNPAPVVISTKLGGRPDPFDPQDKDGLRQSVEESLRLLKRDCIDMLLIHEPDRPGQYNWWTDHDELTGPVLEVFDELKQEGLIRFTGIGGTGVYELARLARTGRFDVVLTAFNYNVVWREAEHAVLAAAKEQNMGIIIGSPLQQGILARRHDEEVQRGPWWLSPQRRQQFLDFYALLDEYDMSMPELAVRFVISNPDISCTLMGARSREEVELNVAAVERGPLPDVLLAQVNEIAGRIPCRPYGEPTVLPLGRGYSGLGRLS